MIPGYRSISSRLNFSPSVQGPVAHQSPRTFPLISFGITGVTENCRSHFCPKTSGWTGMYWPCTPNFTGNGPIFTTLLMFRPIGKVTLLLFLRAYQFTSMLGEVPTDQPAVGK